MATGGRSLHALALGLALLVPAVALAEPPPAPSGSDYETVITPGEAERAFESPRSVELVGSRQLADSPPATTPEALEDTHGIAMQRTNSAGGAPMVRGMLGQHVLLLVDGVRLNNSITRFGPNQLLNTVDPFQIQRVELMRGPGSVLYGSDAMGGVINIITRQPTFDPRRAWDLGAELRGRFDSADRSTLGNMALSGHLRGLGLRVGGSLKRFGDLTGGRGSGTQRFTSYHEGDADVSLRWALSESSQLQASYAAVRQQDAPRTDRSSPTDFRIFSEQYRDLAYLRYGGRFDDSWLRQVSATVSFHDQRELRQRFRLARDTIEREQDRARTLGAQTSARLVLPYTRLTVGLDLYHDWIDSSAETEVISSPIITPLDRGRYVDGSGYTQLGAYLNDRIPLGPKLALDLGGRISGWRIDIPSDPAAGASAVESTRIGGVGGLHARYLLGDGLNLVAGVSQGYRAPNVDDFSAQGCSGQGYDVPTTQLDSEKSVTAETGVKLDLFGRLRGSLFYFYTHVWDQIIRLPTAGPQQVCGTSSSGAPQLVSRYARQNAQAGQIHGVEASVSLALDGHWSLFSWVNWLWGEVQLDLPGPGDFTEPMGRIPPVNGLFGVRYNLMGERGFVALALRWAGRQDRLSSGDRGDLRICPDGPDGCDGTPGYAVVTLRGAARLHRSLRLTLAVENLTNETYRVHGSGVDGAGLSAILGLELVVR